MTLTEFLTARIDEDEAVAQATQSSEFVAYVHDCDWHIEAEGVSHLANFGRESWPLVGEQVAHIARHDPARVLAECEGKRRIVAYAQTAREAWLATGDLVRGGVTHGAEDAMRFLALPYADHPDYQQEWKP